MAEERARSDRSLAEKPHDLFTTVRSLTMRASGLSPRILDAVRVVMEKARRLEGLPDGDADDRGR